MYLLKQYFVFFDFGFKLLIVQVIESAGQDSASLLALSGLLLTFSVKPTTTKFIIRNNNAFTFNASYVNQLNDSLTTTPTVM